MPAGHRSAFGFLNVNKPRGWTSRRVVDHVQQLVKPNKVGHAGTLDPLATGVLLVCVGPATRLVPLVHELSKSYRAEFRLGWTSSTDDIEGEIVEVAGAPVIEREQIEQVLPEFLGTVLQVPPAYSAVKVGGKRAHKLARQGTFPVLTPRPVQIDAIDIVTFSSPTLVLDITCGSGTYIRSLGRDLGQRLGCGGVMSSLIRTRLGSLTSAEGISPDELDKLNWRSRLMTPLEVLPHLPRCEVDAAGLHRIQRGQRIAAPEPDDAPPGVSVALIGPDGTLCALAEMVDETQELAPRQVFVPASRTGSSTSPAKISG